MMYLCGIKDTQKLKELGERLASEIKGKYASIVLKYEAIVAQNQSESEGLTLKISYKYANRLGSVWELNNFLEDHQGTIVNEFGGFDDGDYYSLKKGAPENFRNLLDKLIINQRSQGISPSIESGGKRRAIFNTSILAADKYKDLLKEPWVDENGNIVDDPLV